MISNVQQQQQQQQPQKYDIVYDNIINFKIPNDNNDILNKTPLKKLTSNKTMDKIKTTINNNNNNNNNNDSNCNSQNITKETPNSLWNQQIFTTSTTTTSSSLPPTLPPPIPTSTLSQQTSLKSTLVQSQQHINEENHGEQLTIVRGDRIIEDIHNYSQLSNKNNINNNNYNDTTEEEEDDDEEDDDVTNDSLNKKTETIIDETDEKTPAHHARRPMNAFLIFCKRHRAIVREKYPNLENRSITKILGDWWANLENDEKICYTNLAKVYKDAFFDANPNFKWYKLPAPPLRTLSTRPTNSVVMTTQTINDNNNIGDNININHNNNLKTNRTKNYYEWNNLQEVAREEIGEKDEEQIKMDIIKMEIVEKAVPTPSLQQLKTIHSSVGVFKLADEAQMGGLNSLMISSEMKGKNGNNNINNNNNVGEADDLNVKKSENLDQITALHNALTETSNYFVNQTKSSSKSEPFSNMRDHAAKMQSDSIKNKINKINHTINTNNKHKIEIIDNFDDAKKRKYNKVEKATICVLPTEEQQQQKFITKSNEKPQSIFDETIHYDNLNTNKKSSRACKGKRYQEFMTIGKTTANNPIKKIKQTTKIISTPIGFPHNGYCKSYDDTSLQQQNSNNYDYHNNNCIDNNNRTIIVDVTNKNDEKNKNPNIKTFDASDFELEQKIQALPSLSLDKYLARKRETKKKKKINNKSKNQQTSSFPHHTIFEVREKLQKSMVGSQKRKARKESITRRDILAINDNNNTTVYEQNNTFEKNLNGQQQQQQRTATVTSDLFILATIADIEAKKQNIQI